MKALVFKISFFEHLFKNHYTKAFKLSYPTLLPTTILGLIGNICGYDRKNVYNELKEFYFGSTFLNGYFVEENLTFIQFKKENGKYRSGVVKSQIYHDSEHLVIVAGEEEKLKEKILHKIKILNTDIKEDNFGKWLLIKTVRYPYGGWNDFFAKDIRILNKLLDVSEESMVIGYVPCDLVKNIQENSEIEVLPVKYKGSMSYFVFIKKGYAFLNKKIKSVLNIPIYPINDFNYL